MKIRKRLIAWLMMAVMILGILPMNVQAANNGRIPLNANSMYTQYDVTGDGKKDTLFIDNKGTGKDSKVWVNRKACWTGELSRDGRFFLYEFKKNETFLMLDGRWDCSIFIYKNNKFKEIYNSKNFDLGNGSQISKIDKNILYFESSERRQEIQSLVHHNGRMSEVIATQKVKLENGKAKLVSKFATVKDHVKIRTAEKTFSTSNTYKLTDNKGPKVHKGDKVVVKKCYQKRKGYDLELIFQISVNGKTGWYKDSRKISLR